MWARKRKQFITKVRYPTYTSGGRLVIRYCTNCRIKDGATTGGMLFGTCSFCGRVSRVYTASPWNYPTVSSKNSKYRNNNWNWKRTDTWKDHNLGR